MARSINTRFGFKISNCFNPAKPESASPQIVHSRDWTIARINFRVVSESSTTSIRNSIVFSFILRGSQCVNTENCRSQPWISLLASSMQRRRVVTWLTTADQERRPSEEQDRPAASGDVPKFVPTLLQKPSHFAVMRRRSKSHLSEREINTIANHRIQWESRAPQLLTEGSRPQVLLLYVQVTDNKEREIRSCVP